MSKRQQSYRNNGFRKIMAMVSVFAGNIYNNIFHNNKRNTGKAGGHLDTSYHSGGGSGGSTKRQQSKHKALIEKKRKRKEVQRSKRINRKRAAGVCSFKVR